MNVSSQNAKRAKRIAQVAAVAAVSALSLGAASAEPPAAAKFIAKADSLHPAPIAAAVPAAPIVQQEVVVVAPSGAVSAPVPVARPKRSARPVYGDSGIFDLEKIARCESGGNYTAQNRRSTASGKYQFLNSTWGGYGGYRRAADAPPAVQDAKARATFAKSGWRPWAASRSCWGR